MKRTAAQRDTIVVEAAAREAGLRGELARQWRDGDFVDFDIEVEERVFRVHRVVLAAESAYMRGLCASGHFAESRSCSVTLAEVSASAMEHALTFMYEARVVLSSPKQLQALLQVACRLQASSLIEASIGCIVDRLTADTCIEVMLHAEALSLTKLVEAAATTAKRNFEAVAATDAFGSLSAPLLESLLAANDLSVADEGIVFRALCSWATSQPSPPLHEVTSRLIKCIRFAQMKRCELAAVEATPLVVQHALEVLQAFREAHCEEDTARTRFRSLVTHSEFKVGMSVRVRDLDPTIVERECSKAAPGATDAVEWADEMAACIGVKGTVEEKVDDLAAVNIRFPTLEDQFNCGWCFPCHLLEMA